MSIQAPIFDIQRFSIHDGPGIRTLVFLKGCNFNCSWCQNPESLLNQPEVAFYGHRCQQSFECLKACKLDAIEMQGFRINYDKCSACGECALACAYEAIKIIGENMTPAQLFEKILRDKSYYAESGGGVTFTGGEPTLYPVFIEEVVDLCNAENIHTNLETAGSFSFDIWQPILKKFNLIYFDLKLIDPVEFSTHVGKAYKQVMLNAKLLSDHGFPVEYRIPLVPGITDVDDNINGLAEFLHSINVQTVHLLDYHNMGETKIDIVQSNKRKLGLEHYTAQDRERVESRLLGQGITCLG